MRTQKAQAQLLTLLYVHVQGTIERLTNDHMVRFFLTVVNFMVILTFCAEGSLGTWGGRAHSASSSEGMSHCAVCLWCMQLHNTKC